MNGIELIDEVVDIVLDPRFTREWFLTRLNRGLFAVAGRVLLPGLADGAAAVNTVLNNYVVALPATYHRTLYQASVDGDPVRIYPNIGMMRDVGFKLNSDVGQVEGVAVNAGSLFYQHVPSVVTEIALRFYRKPALLLDTNTSFPDGMGDNTEIAELIDQALIGYACGMAFSRIEDGIEGNKVNTDFHLGRFEDAISRMQENWYARPMPEPPVDKSKWLGW
jgi:hypothetical protein